MIFKLPKLPAHPLAKKLHTFFAWQKENKPIVFMMSCIFLSILILVVSYTLSHTRGAKAAWFDDDWSYRKQITVTVASSASNITDLQTLITVDTSTLISASKLQSSCQDLRFTSQGGKSLPYYIDSGCNTSSTKIWVLVDLVPQNTTTYSMYMYYGNASAPAASDGNSSNFTLVRGMVGYWTMNEASWTVNCSTGTVIDSSVNANNGLSCPTSTGPAGGATGNYANGGTFDGSNDYVSIADSAALDTITGDLTISMWLKPGATQVSSTDIISKHSPGGFLLEQNAANTNSYYFGWDTATNAYTCITASDVFSLTASVWQQLVINKSGNTASYYVNNVLVKTCVGSSATVSTNNLALRLGSWSAAGNRNWNGSMDDVRIYNRSLSTSEMNQLFANPGSIATTATSTSAPTTSFATEEKAPGPLAYWKYDEGQGTTSNDSSGNNITGTLTNGPIIQKEESCISGKCLYFDGGNDTVSYGNQSRLNFDKTSPFSVTLWMRTGSDSSQTLISKQADSAPYAGWNIQTGGGGLIYFQLVNTYSSNILELRTSNVNYADNRWHQVQVTYDGSATPAGVAIYFDGISQPLTTDFNSLSGATTNSTSVYVGSRAASSQFFHGFLDEIKIYNFARTAAQVKSDFIKGAANPGSNAVLGNFDQSVLSNGSVLYWNLDETSGPSTDYSQNLNGATWNGNAATAGGKFGNGVTLDGTGDYLSAGDSTTLSVTGAFSLSAWVNPSSSVASKAIIVKDASYRLVTDASGNPLCQIYNGSWQTAATSSVALTTGSWQHVACSYDQQILRVFVNGVQTGSANLTNAVNDSANALRVGSDSGGTYGDFNGVVDDVRVFNRALPPNQVAALYNWAPGTVGNWPMDENTGTTVGDTSGNQNNGTITGGTWATGKYGAGTSYDGVGDYVTVSNSTSLSPTAQVATEGWFKTSSTFSNTSSTSMGIIDKGDYQFYLDRSDGKAKWVVNNATAAALSALSSGTNASVDTMLVWNGNLYLGGNFFNVGDANGDGIVMWNGSSFSSLGTGVGGNVRSMTIWNGYLVVGGAATDMGGDTNADYVAKWNGSSWSSISGANFNITQTGPLTAGVWSLGVWRNQLIIGGVFDSVNGSTIKGLFSWDGSTIAPLGNGVDPNNGTPVTIFVWQDNLYVGGSFNATTGGVPFCIGKWDGTSWSALGAGLNSIVDSMTTYNGNLVISGNFTDAGGNTNADRITVWDGSTFSALGTGLNNRVRSVSVWNGYLIAGGSFTDAGGDVNADRLAKWDGSAWSALVSGLTSDVNDTITWNGNLYVGGPFSDAGGNTSADFVFKWGSSGTKAVASTTSSWTANTWYHFATTYDGSTMNLYINGKLEGSATSVISSMSNSGMSMLFGTLKGSLDSDNDSDNFFAGVLDNIQIYSYARSSGQVISDENAGHPLGGSPTPSAIINWNYDEQYGTTAHNSGSGGSTYDGTLSGATWLTNTNCKVNGCINLSTTSQYMTANASTLFDGLTNMTVSFWINPSSLTTNSSLVTKLNGTDNAWAVRTGGSSSQLRIIISNSGTDGSNFCATSGLTIDTGVWQHITMVYDGTAPVGSNIKVYKNGRPWTCTVTGTIPTSIRTSTTALRVGTNAGGGAGPVAYMDRVKIYNASLTPDQVLIDYNQGASVNYGTGAPTEDSTLTDTAGNPPVAYWNLDENTGTTANDISGNGNTGTLTNGPVWTPGKVGAALTFDGTNDYVAIPASSSINIDSHSFTVEAWAKRSRNSLGAGEFILGKGDTAGTRQSLHLGFQSSNTVRFGFWGDDLDSTATITDNNWHHIVGTYNSSTNARALYIDGKLAGSNTAGGGLTGTNTGALSIGRQEFADTDYFGGGIDDVKLYDYARTPAQVAYDYNRGLPTAWWRLDECQGTVANDASGNSNTGTLSIGATGTYTTAGTCTSGSSSEAWAAGVNGKFNYSLGFDGTDDYISTTYQMTSSTRTLSAWMKPATFDSSSTYYDILGDDVDASGTNFQGSTIFTRAGTIQARIGDASNVRQSLNGGAYQAGQWYHVVMTYDGTNFKLYVNGILKDSSVQSGYSPSAANFAIGRYSPSALRFFNGQIDDARVYNYALSRAQILQVMNQGGTARYGPLTGSP